MKRIERRYSYNVVDGRTRETTDELDVKKLLLDRHVNGEVEKVEVHIYTQSHAFTVATRDLYSYLTCMRVHTQSHAFTVVTRDHYSYLTCMRVHTQSHAFTVVTRDHYSYLTCMRVGEL